jgi:hypothetical protein
MNRRGRWPKIEVLADTDDHLNGQLCKVEICKSHNGGIAILTFVNAAHPWIEHAMNTPQHALAYCIASRMAPMLMKNYEAEVTQLASAKQLERYRALDPTTHREDREGLMTRMLIDRWMGRG